MNNIDANFIFATQLLLHKHTCIVCAQSISPHISTNSEVIHMFRRFKESISQKNNAQYKKDFQTNSPIMNEVLKICKDHSSLFANTNENSIQCVRETCDVLPSFDFVVDENFNHVLSSCEKEILIRFMKQYKPVYLFDAELYGKIQIFRNNENKTNFAVIDMETV